MKQITQLIIIIIVVVALVLGALFWFLSRQRDSVPAIPLPAEQVLELEAEVRSRLLLPENQQPLDQEEYERRSGRAEFISPQNDAVRKTQEEKKQIHEAIAPKGQ